MFKISLKNFILFIVSTAGCINPCFAQTCINKYSEIKLAGSTYENFTMSVTTPSNEIISAGGLYDYNNEANIVKFTEKGTPVWSYTYKLDYYDFVKGVFFKAVNISDMLATEDGGIIVAGNVDQEISPYGLPPPVKKWALIAKLDKFGKVLWSKVFSNQGDISFTNICQTADGDFIVYMATDNGQKKTFGDHSYGRVLRISPQGKVKWTSLLFTFLFDAGGLGVSNQRAILQAKNNNIIVGDVVHKTGNVFVETKEGNLHFLELDYATGNLKWERSYEYPTPSLAPAYLPDLSQIIELPAGGFSFSTTLYFTAADSITLVKKAAIINISSKGAIQNINAYSPADGSPCSIMQAAIDKNNGNRTLLIDNNGKPSLLQVDNNGQITWQQQYNSSRGLFPANCFSAGKNGFNIFMSNNRSKQYKLLITDAAGAIDCVNEPATFFISPQVLNLSHDSVQTRTDYNFDTYYEYEYPLKRDEDYPLDKTTLCQQTLACCTDFADRQQVADIHICEGNNYTLPNGTIVKDSGTYDVTYKTALGCDSIRYYKVTIDKDIRGLQLGSDTCLDHGSTLIIKATEGYTNYYWMNNSLPKNNSYNVSKPGNYFVRVQNTCGSKTDSIGIFEQCDYPLYIPSAFSPNSDGVNDIFRVPFSNKNKLVRLLVYDRYGQVVFETTNSFEGWNGYYKHQKADPGVYIYYIEMMGLSGNRLIQKGTINLIR